LYIKNCKDEKLKSAKFPTIENVLKPFFIDCR